MPNTNEQKEYNYYIEFEPLEVITKGGNQHSYYVEGYFSTIDEDLALETLTELAQQDILRQIKGRAITLDTEHEIFYSKDGKPLSKPTSNIPIGKVIDAEIRTKGVWGRVEINQSAPTFDNIWNSIKKGFLHSFSVAFYPLEAIKKKVDGVLKSFVNKLNLINITLTGCPVNPEAKFSAVMKSAIDGYKDSFYTYQNIDNTNNEVNSMSEEQKKQVPVEDEIVDEDIDTELEPEVKSKDEVKTETVKDEIDLKSEIASILKSNIELKNSNDSLVAELKAVKEEVEKLKSKPVIKGLKETMNIDKVVQEQTYNAFDIIQ
jgi:HK97 family phage prohead protease